MQGLSQLDSPRKITSQANKELELVEQKIQKAQIQRVDPSQPLQVLIFSTPHSPTAVIVQQNDLVEWLFLPNNFVTSIPTYVQLLFVLILTAHSRVLHLSGQEPNQIVAPFKNNKFLI